MSKVTLEKLRKRIVILEQEAKETTELLAFLVELLEEKGIVKIKGDTIEAVDNEEEDYSNIKVDKEGILETIESADKITLVKLIEICQKGAINFNFKLDIYDFYNLVFKKDLKSFEDLYILDKEELREFTYDLVEKLPKINLVLDCINKLKEKK